jgi:hypothetical protein
VCTLLNNSQHLKRKMCCPNRFPVVGSLNEREFKIESNVWKSFKLHSRDDRKMSGQVAQRSILYAVVFKKRKKIGCVYVSVPHSLPKSRKRVQVYGFFLDNVAVRAANIDSVLKLGFIQTTFVRSNTTRIYLIDQIALTCMVHVSTLLQTSSGISIQGHIQEHATEI